MQQSINILNTLIKSNKYKTYLEIGVDLGNTHKGIVCERKVSVDPSKKYTDLMFQETSDDFFAHNKETFDLIFIDGLHVSDQVIKDFYNSLVILNEGGTIVMHDLIPAKESDQTRERTAVQWMGDVWKAWIQLRREEKDFSMHCINVWPGYGIITKGSQELLQDTDEELTWEYFQKNTKEKMNIITLEEFYKQCKNLKK